MQPSQPTVAVIGGGIIGSWTAWHLAEAGVPTTLFEQFPLPHTRGSSHGLSRAFRLLGDDTLDRLDYALEQWQTLEKATGEPLFIQTGLLNFGPPGDPYLDTYLGVLRRAGRPCGWLDSAAIAARYPMLRYPAAWGAAWDPHGGILLAHRCLHAVQQRFVALGGQIVTACVASVAAHHGGGVTMQVQHTMTGTTEAMAFDRAVVCAGPWTARLLPRLQGLLRSLRIPVTYWHDPSGRYSVAQGCPILFNARLTGIYSLPACEYPGLAKVLVHDGPETDPDTRDLTAVEPYIDKASRYVREHLPGLDPRKPAILEPCCYTMTPDSEPILDRLAPGVVVGCGFSGSGFKHSPATGYMLAALALDREDQLPAGFEAARYRLARFEDAGR